MKTLASFLISVMIAGWIGAIALLSVQNFTPVSLRFLQFQSFQMPVGLVLAFSMGLGLVGAAIALPFILTSSRNDMDEDF